MSTAKRSSGTPARPAASLLILSSKSGSMTEAIAAKLRKAFPDSLAVEFDPQLDIDQLVAPTGRVIVAGGDGTIGWVVRRLADTAHPLGILSLGTYNNFATSLGLPTTLQAAVRVVKTGKARPITLGRLNGQIFLEAAAIGLFGDAIRAGESVKDRAFGAFTEDAKRVLEAKPFSYELSGDIKGSGTCMSLVFTNTQSTGAKIAVSDKTPVEPYLELSVHTGASRTDIVRRVLASALLAKQKEGGQGQVFRFHEIQVTTKPKARIYADNAQLGRTPAVISAEQSALRVILPG